MPANKPSAAALPFLLLLLVTALCGVRPASAQDYTYGCVGNCNSPKAGNPTGGIVLMGGSTDVDDAFRWMTERCGGGDFLVLRASGGNGYNDYVHSFGNTNSVASIVLHHPRAASDPFVVAKAQAACAIWFAGGDQSLYYQWSGSPLQTAVQDSFSHRKVPIGGTSAGMEILAFVVYTGEKGSVTSSEALANPFHPYVTLQPAFLEVPQVYRMLNDMHFLERDRMGRLLVFMARAIMGGMIPDPAAGVPAIAADEATALTIDVDTDEATVRGDGFVYFLHSYLPEVCRPSTPLTYRNISAVRQQHGDVFSLSEWKPLRGGVSYNFDVVNGAYDGSPYGPKFPKGSRANRE